MSHDPRTKNPEPRTAGSLSSASVHWRVSQAQDHDREANSTLALLPARFGFRQGLSEVCNYDGTWATDAARRGRKQNANLLFC